MDSEITEGMPNFRTTFVKNGVTYHAKDYGHKAWPIGGGWKRRTKKTRRPHQKKGAKRQV